MKSSFALFLAVTAIVLPLKSRAEDHLVRMTSSWTFSPGTLTIMAGDRVVWRNDDNFDEHDAVGPGFNTGSVFPDESSSPITFATAGEFPYGDSIYAGLGMTGTIIATNSAQAIPPMLVETESLPGGAFRFTITNLTVGMLAVVDVSTNLVEWTPVATNLADSDSIAFTNVPIAGVSHQFFRASQMP